MMRKQIITLMLSAAIFTTSPLFAMEEDATTKERARIVGRGDFAQFEDKITQDIIETTKDVKTVVNVSYTSREMNALCQDPIFKIYTLNFFSTTRPPKVPIKYLNFFMTQPYPDSDYPCSWCFSLGNERFQIINDVGLNTLDPLDPSAMATFGYYPPQDNRAMASFRTWVPVYSNLDGINPPLDSPEYNVIIHQAFKSGDNNFSPNNFIIIRLEHPFLLHTDACLPEKSGIH